MFLPIEPILSRVLDLKVGRLSRAILWCFPTRGPDPIPFRETITLRLSPQLEPIYRSRSLPARTGTRLRRRHDIGFLFAGEQSDLGRPEIEGGDEIGGEVVVAGDGEAGMFEGFVGQGEKVGNQDLEDDLAFEGREEGEDGKNIEEGGDGAVGFGDAIGGRLGAGVVLGTAAEGDCFES